MITPGIYSDDIIANDRFNKYFDTPVSEICSQDAICKALALFCHIASVAFENRYITLYLYGSEYRKSKMHHSVPLHYD